MGVKGKTGFRQLPAKLRAVGQGPIPYKGVLRPLPTPDHGLTGLGRQTRRPAVDQHTVPALP